MLLLLPLLFVNKTAITIAMNVLPTVSVCTISAYTSSPTNNCKHLNITTSAAADTDNLRTTTSYQLIPLLVVVVNSTTSTTTSYQLISLLVLVTTS